MPGILPTKHFTLLLEIQLLESLTYLNNKPPSGVVFLCPVLYINELYLKAQINFKRQIMALFLELGNYTRSAKKIIRSGIPEEINDISKRWDIEVARCELELLKDVNTNSMVWIGSRQAPPHIDSLWRNYYFLIFVVKGDHLLGYKDGQAESPSISAMQGDLFLLDPIKEHWLFDVQSFQKNQPPRPWLAVQWEIPKRNYQKTIEKFVDKIQQLNSRT